MRTMRGPNSGAEFCYMGENLKLHKSVTEQIEHLKARGVLIDDEREAEVFLSNVNYYRL